MKTRTQAVNGSGILCALFTWTTLLLLTLILPARLSAQPVPVQASNSSLATLVSPLNFLVSNILAGANITIDVTNHAGKLSAIRIHAAGGGGSGLTTNEFQFLGVPLSIIDGARLTNAPLFGISTNMGASQEPFTDFGTDLGTGSKSYFNAFISALRIRDAVGGPSFISIIAPILGGSYAVTLPDAQGASGQVMTNNGAGDLGWWTPGSPTGHNPNQFITNAAVVSIRAGALLTNTVHWQSNALQPALIVTNQPGGTVDLFTFLATNGAGIRGTSNGAVVVHGVIGSTTNSFEVRRSNNAAAIFGVTHSNTVRIVGPLQPGYGATLVIQSEEGSTQNNIELFAGSVLSGRWRSDNAGNQIISAEGGGALNFNYDGIASGRVGFGAPGLGDLWALIPSSAVAAWHGGTLRRGQISNVWDVFVRSNVNWTEVGGSDRVFLQSTSGMSSYTMFLPITNGLAGQVLYNVGGGELSWKDDATTPQPGLTTNANQFLGVPLSIIGGAFLTNMNFWGTGTNNGTLFVGGSVNPLTAAGGSLGADTLPWASISVSDDGVRLVETGGGGSDAIILLAPSSLISPYTLILPDTQGANRTTLTNNGSGNLGWWEPYFGGTNIYRFNPNHFLNNDVTNVNIKSGLQITNILAYEFENSAAALVITQHIGSATNALEIVSSNKEQVILVTSNSTFFVKGVTGRTNDGFVVARTNRTATLMVRSNDLTVATNVVVYPLGDEVGVPYRLFSMTNSSILTNKTTSANIISNYAGRISLPANFWTPGKRVQLKFRGSYFSPAGTFTWTNAVFVGSTMLASNLVPLLSSVAGDVWEEEIDIVCRGEGASGTLVCHGMCVIPSAAGGTSAIGRRVRLASGAVTVDTTAAAEISVTFHPSATTRALEIYIGHGTVYP